MNQNEHSISKLLVAVLVLAVVLNTLSLITAALNLTPLRKAGEIEPKCEDSELPADDAQQQRRSTPRQPDPRHPAGIRANEFNG